MAKVTPLSSYSKWTSTRSRYIHDLGMGRGGDLRGLLTNPVEAACHASLIVTAAPSGHLHLGGDLRICFRPTFHFEFNFQFHVLIINFDQSFEVVCNVHGSFCLL